MKNVLIGDKIKDNGFDRLTLIGDDLIATEDGQILVGKTLFGKPTPQYLEIMIELYSEELGWLLNSIGIVSDS